MKLVQLIITAAFVTTTANAACDPDEAAERLQLSLDGGLVQGMSMYQDTPTLHINRGDWNTYPLEVRLGLFVRLGCAIAGPDNVLRRSQIVDQGGALLATWDGIREEMTLAD